jgi:hypothetical protein
MQPHQQRVVGEHTELRERLAKLDVFIAGPLFRGLPEDDRTLLLEQRHHMSNYALVLSVRIQRFHAAAPATMQTPGET